MDAKKIKAWRDVNGIPSDVEDEPLPALEDAWKCDACGDIYEDEADANACCKHEND